MKSAPSALRERETFPPHCLLHESSRLMVLSALHRSPLDPTSIFEHFRGSYGSELLTVAVAHFDLFNRLAAGPKAEQQLGEELGLERRPAVVLLTAMKAMGLLTAQDGQLTLSPLARQHLCRDAEWNVADYIGLAAESAGVLDMLQRLRTNRPAGGGEDEAGTAFIYRDGQRSAMEQKEAARHFTLALAGRAKIVAPALADAVDLTDCRRLLDLGGGTGIYSIALLQKYPNLEAVVFDRPEVLKIAAAFAGDYGVADRMNLAAGDMFAGMLPSDCDAILLSNVLHDWDEPECRKLIARCAAALPAGGRILIHDVYLNDSLDGPLPIALYSAALFTLTEGRAYSAAEYRSWLAESGFDTGEIVPTLIHCGVLSGYRR